MLEAVFIEGIFAHAGDFQPDGAPTDMEAKVGAPGGTRVGGLEVAAEAAIPEAAGGDDLVLGRRGRARYGGAHEDYLPPEPHVSAGAHGPGQGDDARRHGEV